MTIDEAKEEIKRRVNLREFAISHGIKHYSGSLFHSPFRSDKSPSFGIHQGPAGEWYFKDFSTQAPEPRAGDIITYVEKLNNCGFIEAVKFLANYCGITLTETARNEGPATVPAARGTLKLKPRAAEYTPIETGSRLFIEYRDQFINKGATRQEADRLALIEVKDAVYSDIVEYCAATDYTDALKDYLTRGRAISLATAEKFLLFETRDIRGLQRVLTEKYQTDDLILSGVLGERGEYWNIERGRVYIPYNEGGKYTYLKGRYIPQTDRNGAAAIISQWDHLKRPDKVRPVTVKTVINSIRTGIYTTAAGEIDIRPGIKEIQALADKRAAAQTKEEKKSLDTQLKETKAARLPAFCFAGLFDYRSNESIKTYEGIYTVDIDHITEDIQAVKDQISNDPFTFAAFISPSGQGLKVLVKIPLMGDNKPGVIYHHGQAFEALRTYYALSYGIEIDKQCKDLARLCYGCYDPEIYVNEGARLFEGFIPKYKQIGSGRAGLKLYNFDALAQTEGKEIYLTAGEFDTILLSQIGFTAFSLFKDEEPIPPEALDRLKGFTVNIMIDNDPAGNKRAAEVMETLTKAGITARRYELPPGMDVTDYIKSVMKGKQ